MATRFYFTQTTESSASPSDVGSWGSYGLSATQKKLTLDTPDSSSGGYSRAETAGSATPVGIMKFVSPPLKAATVGLSTIKFAGRFVEDDAKMDAVVRLAFGKCDTDGSNATLFGTVQLDDTELNNGTYPTDLVNRFFSGSTTGGSITNGQRLIIEVGVYADNTKTNTITAYFGCNSDSGTDLGENDTDTAAYNSWFETGDVFELYTPTVVLNTPLDEATGQSTTPTVEFTGTSVPGNDLEYNVQIIESNSPGATIESHPTSYEDGGGSILNDSYFGEGQAFTLATGAVISRVDFYLRKVNSPTGNMVVNIYDVTGTVGSSACPVTDAVPLYTSTTTLDVSTLTTGYVLKQFNFSNVYLPAGDYAVVAYWDDGTSTNTVFAGNDSTTPAHSGNSVYANSDGTWGAAPADVIFYVIGDSVGAVDIDADSSVPDFGFANVDTPADTHPFNSADKCDYDGSILIDEYGIGNFSSNQSLYSIADTAIGQCFTIASSQEISKVFAYLRKTGTPTGYVYAKIYNVTGTVGSTAVPTGSPLATSTGIDISTISDTTQEEIEFSFSSPYSASSGDYCIVIEYTGGSGSDYLRVGIDNTSPSHSGNAATYDPPTWTASTSIALIFYLGKPLSASTTYYWRVRAKAPSGTNTWGDWATTRTFTTGAAGSPSSSISPSPSPTPSASISASSSPSPSASSSASSSASLSPSASISPSISASISASPSASFSASVSASSSASISPSISDSASVSASPSASPSSSASPSISPSVPPEAFEEDNFNNESLEAFWTWYTATGGSRDENASGQHVINAGIGDTWHGNYNPTWIYQEYIGDFDVWAKFEPDASWEVNWQFCGILAEIDGSNPYYWVLAYLLYNLDEARFRYAHTVNSTSYATSTAPQGTLSSWYLRLKRSGNTFTAYYSVTKPEADEDWTQMSTPSTVNQTSSLVKLGIHATRADAGSAFTLYNDFILNWVPHSHSPSASASPSLSASKSASVSPSPSSSESASVSSSPSASPSPSASVSPSVSSSPSASPSASQSPSASVSPSISPSPSASVSPSVSPSPSASQSPSSSPSPSVSPSPSASESASVSLSSSASQSPSASVSPSVSSSLSASQSPSATSSPSISSSPSASVSLSPSSSSSASQSPSASVSASVSSSPSASVSSSPSSSLSASQSPSASVSPSVSPSPSASISLSVSSSPSASQSPSASISLSVSLSPSASVSASPSPSVSASVSPSPSEGYEHYTRQAIGTLPTTKADLAITYSGQDYTDVSADDGVRVGISGGSSEYMIHQYKDFIGDASSISLYWDGKTDLAPSSSTVYLQIFNEDTQSWETVDSDNATAADTDFVLQASIPDTTDYVRGGLITCRVYQLGT